VVPGPGQYEFTAALKGLGAAAHLRLAVLPPDAIGSAASAGGARGSRCQAARAANAGHFPLNLHMF